MLSTSSVRTARLSLLSCLPLLWMMASLAILTSLLLLSTPSPSPLLAQLTSPLLSTPGLPGLLVACLLSALLSCLSSSILSLASLLWEDWLVLTSCTASLVSSSRVALVRGLATLLGLAVGLLAYGLSLLEQVPSPATPLAVVAGPLLATFLLGLLVPRSTKVVSASFHSNPHHISSPGRRHRAAGRRGPHPMAPPRAPPLPLPPSLPAPRQP